MQLTWQCIGGINLQYRKFGKTDFEVSALGFGCMRLPVIDDDYSKINEEEAIKLVRYAIDNGINYIDTAYPYHKGNSEIFVGKALKDGYREKVKLATKLPVWLVKESSDFDKFLNEQLEKLQTDHIDMYLLHALDKKRIDELEALGIYEFLDNAIQSGKIKYAGFSFHDDVNTFKRIIDAYNWTFCQIQYNILDENYQAGTEGLKYAASKGLAVVIMEPLKGGKLAVSIPDSVKEVYNSSKLDKSPANLALSWVWNHPEVSLLLSGMNTFDQLTENIETSEKAIPNSLSNEELALIENVKNAYKKCIKVDCTRCEYCMPCPFGVNIPENFSMYNNVYMYNALEENIKSYANMGESSKAGFCKECGKCETVCPQHLPIRKHLKEAHVVLGRKI